MNFEPGRDREGRVPLHKDGKPVFKTCGPYTILRAIGENGLICQAWYKGPEMDMADVLGSGTHRQALKLCEDHCDEHHPEIS